MRIAIVTVYEPITNLGSYLQCYAMKTFLEEQGHDVTVVGNKRLYKQIFKYGLRLNPKRAFFLRLKKIFYTIKDVSKLNVVYKKNWNPDSYDVVIYGSDEIWNLNNPYFADDLFWGINVDLPKIGYAVSVGHMSEEELNLFPQYKTSIGSFLKVYPRDTFTYGMLYNLCPLSENVVGDPTLLVDLDCLSKPVTQIKEQYIVVYSYGLSTIHIEYVKRFARENNLKIVSPCFWHYWADKVVECSALQFSSLIKDAEYIFTTTFHGAIFTLLNHKKACIFSQRPKVNDLVESLGAGQYLLRDDAAYEDFERTINIEFPKEEFESKLNKLRQYSINELYNTLQSLK